MDLSNIVSITGKSGLYQILSRTHNGVVVESLDDRKKKFKVDTNFQIAVLDEITIYTFDESDLHLKDIFYNICKKDGAKTSVGPKEKPAVLREYFDEVAPSHDEDRVYPSDIKKIIQWYNILSEQNLLDFSEYEQKADEEQEKADNSASGSEQTEEEKGNDNSGG